MKKILIFLLGAIFLTSCGTTKITDSYISPVNPNLPVTENTLKAEGIDPQALVGTYMAFNTEALFIKSSDVEVNQEAQAGALIIDTKLKGSRIYVPYSYDVLWQIKKTPVTGPLEGTNLRSGEIMKGRFMAEVESVQTGGPGGYLERLFMKLQEDTIGDVFSYKRTPQIDWDKFYKENKFSAGNFQPLREREKESSKKQNLTPSDYLYVIELLVFQPDMKLSPGYAVESSTNLVYYDNGKAKFYLALGSSGNYWKISERNKFHCVSEMYVERYLDDDQKLRTIDTKIIGKQ